MAVDKRYHRAFVRQQDQSDCGVACLAALARYYGGRLSLERLRELSGTDKDGTSLLGLYQSAQQVGFSVEAFEGDVESLKALEQTSILHIVLPDQRQHYIIFYGFDGRHFIISDPERGILRWTPEELEERWASKALITLRPNDQFQKNDDQNREKWHWFRELIREDVNILGVSLVLGIFISILSLAVAVFSQKLIDEILPDKDLPKLQIGLALLAFLLFMKAGFGYIRQYFLIRQSKDFNNRIIRYFFGSLVYLSKSFFDNRKTGDLIARLNDTTRVQRALSYIASSLLIDLLLTIVSIIFIFNYSTWLGLLALINFPVLLLIVYFYHRPVLNANRIVMESYANNESHFVDTITGIGTIKANNRENFFSRITEQIYRLFQDHIFNLGVVGMRFTLATEITTTVVMVGVIALSSFMVLYDQLQLGEMMAVIQMNAMLLPSAGRLAMTNVQLQEARVAFERMYEFTSLRPEYLRQSDRQAIDIDRFEELNVDSLSFRYPGRPALLHAISFRIRKGEMVSILGESGCGKTTTLQILQRFYGYENGSIRVNGRSWEDIRTDSWRQLIGVVPQDIKIFNGTLLHNICLGTDPENVQEVITTLDQYGFTEFFNKLPQGYGTMLGENGINISEGQKQLVAFARVLHRRPQLLLLDEPTASLDRRTEAKILDLLEQLRQQAGILIITHSITVARKTDRIYVMDQGRIVAEGDHNELMKHTNLYSEFWRSLQV